MLSKKDIPPLTIVTTNLNLGQFMPYTKMFNSTSLVEKLSWLLLIQILLVSRHLGLGRLLFSVLISYLVLVGWVFISLRESGGYEMPLGS